jgi:hypothetical protein
MTFVILVGSLSSGLFHPAYCESEPRSRFYAYLKALYYATHVKQVSKFWIKNGRVPMDECLGTAEAAKLAELKSGYIYSPQIQTEILNGNTCTMKGVGWGSSQGHRLRAKLDVVMAFEEGEWRIQYYTWQGQIPGHY